MAPSGMWKKTLGLKHRMGLFSMGRDAGNGQMTPNVLDEVTKLVFIPRALGKRWVLSKGDDVTRFKF